MSSRPHDPHCQQVLEAVRHPRQRDVTDRARNHLYGGGAGELDDAVEKREIMAQPFELLGSTANAFIRSRYSSQVNCILSAAQSIVDKEPMVCKSIDGVNDARGECLHGLLNTLALDGCWHRCTDLPKPSSTPLLILNPSSCLCASAHQTAPSQHTSTRPQGRRVRKAERQLRSPTAISASKASASPFG